MRLTIAFCILLASGCVAPAAVQPASTQSVSLDPSKLPFLALDHDHADPKLHHGGASGLSMTAHLRLAEDVRTGYFGELDSMGDLVAQAFEDRQAGFTLLSIKDPDHPVRLSHVGLDDCIVTDVKFAPDARTLFVSTSSWILLGNQARLVRDPTALPTLTRAMGIIAYDVSDPSAPREISYTPVGHDGVHMLDVHVIHGVTWAFATTPFYSPAALATQPLPIGSPDNAIEILRWDGKTLTQVASYDAPEKRGYDFAHDVTVVDDGDRVLMLGAYAVLGASIADVTDPSHPKHLGSFLLSESGVKNSDVHTVVMERVAGRRILVTSPELGEDGEMLTIDATDAAHPQLIGRWALPDWTQRKGAMWSPHNVNVIDGKAYLAHYHAGAWVLDISTNETLVHPKLLGYFAPADSDHPPTKNFLYAGEAPSTWEVLPTHGRLLVSDMGTGFYVLKADWAVGDAPPYGTRTTP